MALTEIPVELSSTPGIADSSNATAITIDSSENTTFAGQIHLSSTDPIVKFTDTAGGDTFGIFGSASDFLGFYNFSDSRTDMAIDGSGNLGIGNLPLATGTGQMSIRVGASGLINAHSGSASSGQVMGFSQNAHYDTDDSWEAISTAAATNYYQGSGTHYFRVAASTSAGADITWINAMTIDSDGHVTTPLQSAFSAYTSAQNLNIPTDASAITVAFGAEYFDQNSDFNTSTYTFTAPVTGKYQLMTNLYVNDADMDAQYIRIRIATSNRNYDQLYDPRVFDTDPTRYNFHSSVLADMDASDTAVIQISQYEGTAQMDVPVSVVNNFSGYLVA